ncbi:MAG: alpha/beta hydrolase [Chloroflexi bacterium]|nr:alpha/beta hydrolase [Chloroflexota bacterium]
MNVHRLRLTDVELALYEREGAPPTVLFLHATGFHGRIWDQVIERLGDVHTFALDQRGHGQSETPTLPPEWHTFAGDVVALGDHFSWTGIVGVGHSIGGHALTAAAAARPGLFARLLLIDPVIMPEAYYVGILEGEHFTARRRKDWRSPDEMFERFRERAPFDRWDEAVLRDYVGHGLRPNTGGEGYVLACDPAFEAASYNYGSAANIYPLLSSVHIPVTILRAAGHADASVNNFSASPTAPDLAGRFPNARDVSLPEYSHFIPMEAPDRTAEFVREEINAVRS